MPRRYRPLTIVAAVAIFLASFLWLQNNWLEVSRFTFPLDEAAEKIRIVHLSDLHGKLFGPSNQRLVKKTTSLDPDIIVVTGDWIDQNTADSSDAAKTLAELNKLAPVFYVPGNHEYWRDGLQEWQEELAGYGLHMMQNEIETIVIRDTAINILGLDEATTAPDSKESYDLFEALADLDGVSIVLAHYPENLALLEKDSYEQRDFDLMFAGHAHGGQIILPFIGGLVSPGEGFCPHYYRGSHDGSKVHPSGNISRMIISRGLGNSIIPLRLFNRPEIVVVELEPSNTAP